MYTDSPPLTATLQTPTCTQLSIPQHSTLHTPSPSLSTPSNFATIQLVCSKIFFFFGGGGVASTATCISMTYPPSPPHPFTHTHTHTHTISISLTWPVVGVGGAHFNCSWHFSGFNRFLGNKTESCKHCTLELPNKPLVATAGVVALYSIKNQGNFEVCFESGHSFVTYIAVLS